MLTRDETVRKYSLLWRAIVEPLKAADPERVVFVEAFSRDEARRKLLAAIAAIDACSASEVEYYNLEDIRDLVDHHLSEEHELRLFETGGGSRDGVPYEVYCQDPLFLVKDPRRLIDVWTRCHARGRE